MKINLLQVLGIVKQKIFKSPVVAIIVLVILFSYSSHYSYRRFNRPPSKEVCPSFNFWNFPYPSTNRDRVIHKDIRGILRSDVSLPAFGDEKKEAVVRDLIGLLGRPRSKLKKDLRRCSKVADMLIDGLLYQARYSSEKPAAAVNRSWESGYVEVSYSLFISIKGLVRRMYRKRRRAGRLKIRIAAIIAYLAVWIDSYYDLLIFERSYYEVHKPTLAKRPKGAIVRAKEEKHYGGKAWANCVRRIMREFGRNQLYYSFLTDYSALVKFKKTKTAPEFDDGKKAIIATAVVSIMAEADVSVIDDLEKHYMARFLAYGLATMVVSEMLVTRLRPELPVNVVNLSIERSWMGSPKVITTNELSTLINFKLIEYYGHNEEFTKIMERIQSYLANWIDLYTIVNLKHRSWLEKTKVLKRSGNWSSIAFHLKGERIVFL